MGVNESACQDEDFFDGSAGSNPAVLPGGWFNSMWARDIPVMKEMGANTIRIYHTSPWTKDYTTASIGTDGIQFPYGKSHKEFLDMADKNGLKVIYPLPGEYDWLVNYSEEKMYQLIKNVVDEVKIF
jgi:beta-galactosidase GanA